MADVLAPPADAPMDEASPRGAGPVIQGGLATTFVTLAVLFLFGHYDVDFNPMGFYAWYIVPAGAILVGLCAGSGYGLVSWFRGVRIQRKLLVGVVILQFLAYGAAEYLEYRDILGRVQEEAARDGQSVDEPGFLNYYHHKAINFAWKAKHGDGIGEPLGLFGYVFVGLAAVGFIGGGLIGPLATASQPYCAGCQRYMRTKNLGLIPASVMNRKFKKADAAEGKVEWEADNDAAATAAQTHANELIRLAEAGDVDTFRATGQSAFGPKKATDKLPIRISTDLVHCPACYRGWLRHSAVSGQGKEVRRVPVSQIEVSGAFGEGVLAPRTA